MVASSVLLILFLIFFGVPALARIVAFVSELNSTSVPVVLNDTIPPAPPKIFTLPEYTKEKRITISGTAEAGSTLIFFINGQKEKETVVDASSNFSLEARLSEGENNIWAKAIDQAKNESAESEKQTVIFDDNPPEITIDSPKDGETFYGPSAKTIEVRGSIDENAQIFVNDRRAVVDSENNFSTTVSLSEGENILTIKALDRSENESEEIIRVNYSP